MTVRLVLVCDGAAYFDDGTPDFDTFKCSRTLPAQAFDAYDDRADLLATARQYGWRIGPKGDVMCPDCCKPDPKTLRLIEAMGATRRAS